MLHPTVHGKAKVDLGIATKDSLQAAMMELTMATILVRRPLVFLLSLSTSTMTRYLPLPLHHLKKQLKAK